MRSHYCGQISEELIDQEVTLCGWVNRRRDHGGVIFVDLRDREGLVQVVFDPDRAETILEQALAVATGQETAVSPTGIYRDLDVRAIAVAWARINPDRSVTVAERVYDPGLRAWALWEIAGISGDETLYDQAAEAAREVSDPVDRARSLRELAVRSGDRALLDEALAALHGVEDRARMAMTPVARSMLPSPAVPIKRTTGRSPELSGTEPRRRGRGGGREVARRQAVCSPRPACAAKPQRKLPSSRLPLGWCSVRRLRVRRVVYRWR